MSLGSSVMEEGSRRSRIKAYLNELDDPTNAGTHVLDKRPM
jgi:hypothetical protein